LDDYDLTQDLQDVHDDTTRYRASDTWHEQEEILVHPIKRPFQEDTKKQHYDYRSKTDSS